MSSNNSKKGTVIIDDDMINNTIAAIEATEPTPDEREKEQLNKLIPYICMARARGESDERIRRKIKSAMPRLHYSKVDKLFSDADELDREHGDQGDQGDQNDHLSGDEVHHDARV
jgi:hypothetical protein